MPTVRSRDGRPDHQRPGTAIPLRPLPSRLRQEHEPKLLGANFDRLAEVKKTYDPHNLFRVNRNIPPASRPVRQRRTRRRKL
ncbi:MAG: BBE domain-containing protein [Chloroflexi bacterium]|nr:BBE domain-containing protein [Chloroflexota bacterium]